MDPSDAEAALWHAALGGDPRAFGEIFDRHHDRVFRHVLGLVEQAADADEVAASAFLELWRLRHRVRVVGGSVLPWLLVTAGHLARNDGRRRRRYRRLVGELRGATSPDRRSDAADVAVERLHLAAALRRLSTADADVVLLAAELPPDEVAAALGITPGAARVRLHRARVRLRRILGAEPDVPILERRR